MTTTATTSNGARYRIDHPTLAGVLADLRLPAGDLGPGDRIPDFDLPTTTGGRVTRADLAADPRPTLLVFGSLTCPVTESGADGLRELHARYGDRIRFLLVSVREAHPGRSVRQPRTLEDKTRNARALKDRHRFGFDVAVDDLDGTLHRAFGPRPNSAFLIHSDGQILFRAQWANVTDALDTALDAVTAGREMRRRTATHTLRASMIMSGHADAAFATAGRGALLDTWKVAPPFGAMIVVSRLFGFLPRSRRGLPTMLLMGLATTAAIAAIILTR